MGWREYVGNNNDKIIEMCNSRPYSDLFLISQFVNEVENGGIIQYLDNMTGDQFGELSVSVNNINCDFLKSLVVSITEKFPGGVVPSDQNQRGELLDILLDENDDDPFDALTDLFNQNTEAVDYCINEYLIDAGLM